MVKDRRAGRFHGYRKNCEFVPCLPARVVAAYLADPRRIPYLLVWVRRPLPIEKALKLAHPLEIRDCVRLASHSFRQGEAPEPGWVEAKRGDGRRIGIQVLERSLPRNGGKDLLLVCNHCHKPRRTLYGWEALKHVRQIKTADWVCRSCADLSYASEGGAGIFRTRWSVARPLSGLRLWPRPELWQPLVLTSPLQMLELGLVDNVYLNGARL